MDESNELDSEDTTFTLKQLEYFDGPLKLEELIFFLNFPSCRVIWQRHERGICVSYFIFQISEEVI